MPSFLSIILQRWLRLVTTTVLLLVVSPAFAEDYGGYYGVITDPHDPPPEVAPPDDGSPPILGTNYGPPKARDLRKNNLNESVGVVINTVYPDTAADEMGLQQGDIIVQIGETPIDSMQAVRDEVMANSPGDPVSVTVLRDGEEQTVSGNYGRWPDSIPYQPIDEEADRRYRSIQNRRLANQRDRPSTVGERSTQSPLTPAGAASAGLGALAERAVEQNEQAAAARTPAQEGDRLLVTGIAMTRGMPAWKFAYQVHVEDADSQSLASETAGATTAGATTDGAAIDPVDPVLAAELAAAAPQMNVNFRARVAYGAL